MDAHEFLKKLASLKRAQGRGGREGMKAPHKPILILVLLSRIEEGKASENRFRFTDLKPAFDALWSRYGWNTKTRAAFPFWHLTSDGFWILQEGESPISIGDRGLPADAVLAREVLYGKFSSEVWKDLQAPALRRRAMDFLIETYFPASVREELREELGVPCSPLPESLPEEPSSPVSRRDPYAQKKFRDTVLLAYGRRCAVCGFGPRQDRAPSAIAAAHIWPVEHGGPFTIENGLALCPIHHWALDSGTISFADDGTILVSARVTDGETLRTYVQAHAGGRIREPLPKYPRPSPKYLGLHREQLFQGEAM